MFEFEYKEIDITPGGDHIRLLSLVASETFTDPICVSLSDVKLTSLPCYEALSYCWGDASEKCLIFCDSRPFKVTRNLESALRHLRQRQGDRVLWIDAICIDQNNPAERSHQVNLMRHIYQIASKVLVWLGDDGDGSDLVLPLCERTTEFWGGLIFDGSLNIGDPRLLFRPDAKPILKEKLKEINRRKARLRSQGQQCSEASRTETNGCQGDNGVIPSETSEQEKNEMQDPTKEEVAASLQLINRPWFSRCWVVQEVSLAREALVVCGTSSLKWESFYWGFFFIMILGGGFRGRPERIYKSNLNLMTAMRQKLHYANGSIRADRVDLLHLLWRTRRLDATDPRDKVYSVLGLIDLKEAQVQELTPDYTISVEECYKRAAISIMSYTGNLDILATEFNPDSKLNLPSWVPDWERSTSPTPTASIIRNDDRKRASSPRYKPFRASSSAQGTTSFRVNRDVLTLSGYVFDTVVALEDTLTESQWNHLDVVNVTSISTFVSYMKVFFCDLGENHDMLVKWDRFALSPKYFTYPTGEDPETAFAMTMCARDFNGPEAALAEFREWRKILRGPKAVSFLRRITGDSQIYKSLVGVAAVMSFMYYGSARLYLTVAGGTLYRRLARTEKGYLALVPSRSAVGDQISLFRGGKVPFVIRSIPQESTYRLIGSSYVHGIMYGEAWDDALSGDISIV
ncbi:heterokaryon incompatibility protein-domain-containing protein [Xylaria sp. FL0933]|nr:heterokaryon incompatibility protein-domain-containing protein [Xylaria sp. FL0933]